MSRNLGHVALLLALLPDTVGATALEQLRARLGGLKPEGVVRARIDVASSSESSEQTGKSSGIESAIAEIGPDGLRLLWTTDQLAAASAAQWRSIREPDTPYSGTSLGQVSPDDAASFLDHADRLLMALEGATLVEQRPDASRGAGGHLMRLTPKRSLSAADEKLVKKYEDELTIWLDGDGWPVATARRVNFRGSKLLVSFGSETKVARELRLVSGRLVVTSERYERSGDAMGEKGSGAVVTTVTLLP